MDDPPLLVQGGYRLGARGINWASLDPELSPVLEIVSALHLRADLTLGMGEVIYDYMAEPK